MNIIQKSGLNSNCYYGVYRQKGDITTIGLHHTLGPKTSVDSVISTFNTRTATNPSGLKISTPFIIDGAGNIYQLFDEAYASDHGVRNQKSIGIELCNLGPVGYNTEEGRWENTLGVHGSTYLSPSDIITLPQPFRQHTSKNGKFKCGGLYYHNYPTAQIDALIDLIVYLCNKWGIPIYTPLTTPAGFGWRQNNNEANKVPGIYSHTNTVAEEGDLLAPAKLRGKEDIYPHPYLMSRLAAINGQAVSSPIVTNSPGSSFVGSTGSNSRTFNNPNINVATPLNGVQGTNVGGFESADQFNENFTAFFNQIDRNVANIELSQTEATWGKRSNELEESDWIGLRQFLLYLTSFYNPGSLLPFVELIPTYDLTQASQESFNQGYAKEGSVSKETLSQLSKNWKTSFNPLADQIANASKYLSNPNTSQNNFNEFINKFGGQNSFDVGNSPDLFTLDPFKEGISQMGVSSKAGQSIKDVRGIGYRIYGQLVSTPEHVGKTNGSKPGAIGFTKFEVQAGSQANNGLALITLELHDLQGNKFTDLNSPWSFIFNVRTGSQAGDFYFRYGWQIRVPMPGDESDKFSKPFWEHEGWKIFGEGVRKEMMTRVKTGSLLLTLTQSSNFDSIFRSETYDSSTQQFTINKNLLYDGKSYVKLAVLNPEINTNADGSMTAKLLFRTTAALLGDCPLAQSLLTQNLVLNRKEVTLTELLVAIEHDNNMFSLYPIENPELRKNKEAQISKATSLNIDRMLAGDTNQNLVKVVGPYRGGNRGGGINPNLVKLTITDERAAEFLPVNKLDKSLLAWFRDVLLENDCTLLSAAYGSGAGINAAYVITTTQQIDIDNSNIQKQSVQVNGEVVRSNGQIVSIAGDMIDVDVFSYRFQGSLVESINFTKSDKPNALTRKANFDFANLSTYDSETITGEIKPPTIAEKKRNLMILFSQMEMVEISCICHPWIGPGCSVFLKGTGIFDGEYMCLEVTHNNEGKFTSLLKCARIRPVDDTQDQMIENKTEAKLDGNSNFASAVTSQQSDVNYLIGKKDSSNNGSFKGSL